jgi:alkylation response protein AidB-like acyl-CoA dehydrogenase
MIMRFLENERECLERFLPRLDAQLAAQSMAELERPGNMGIDLFRRAGGAGLLVPKELGGQGASALEAARVHRALGARSPSLAIAATMHNFTLATLVEFSLFGDEGSRAFVSNVAAHGLLVSSAFAEGRPGAAILSPVLEARATDRGYVLNGSKKPCTLSRSMNVLCGSASVPDPSGRAPRRAVVLVPAEAAGIERRPFWNTTVLAGAESEEVILRDVEIPRDALFFPQLEDRLDPVEVAGYTWFQILVSASYLGAASALVERAIESGRGGAGEQALLGIDVEGAMAALEGVARALGDGLRGEELLTRSLFVRYAVQGAIERTTSLAAELLGGIAFIRSADVAYLLAATRALAFHPPSRLSASAALAGYLAGQPLGTL